jgi:hypothetical protein
VHVPFIGRNHLADPKHYNTTFQEKCCLTNKQRDHFRVFLQRFGLRILNRHWSYDEAFRDCVGRLMFCEALRTLKLVLPPTFYINHNTIHPMERLDWYWKQLRSVKVCRDQYRESRGLKPMHVGFVFFKMKDTEVELPGNGVDRRRFPWLVRYTGQCKRMVEKVKELDWITSIEYAVPDRQGKYEVVGRETCEKEAGKRALLLEEIDEDSWAWEDAA